MIDYRLKDLFWQSSVDHQLKLEFSGGDVITNEDIYSESMEITESLCSEQELHFGACESSQFKIRIANSFTSHIGQTVKVSMTLGGDTENPFVFGTYKVQSDKATADRRYRDITAYDAMYDILNADVSSWFNTVLPNVDSTVTLKEFRDSFFEYLEIEQEDVVLVNDDMTVAKTIGTEQDGTLSGKTIINAICEINGVFGHITRDNKFRYVSLTTIAGNLYPSDDLYPSDEVFPSIPLHTTGYDTRWYKSCKYDDFLVAKIDRVQIRQEENDVGYAYPTNLENVNTYILQGNFLAYGKSSKELSVIAKNLFGNVNNISYIPSQIGAISNPCIEVGDAISLGTKYQIIYTYMLQRSIKGIQALSDNITANGTEKYSKVYNSVGEQLIQLRGKYATVEKSIEGFKTEVGEKYTTKDESANQKSTITEEYTSAISQSAEEITTSVSSTYETKASSTEKYSALSQRADGFEQSVKETYETKADAGTMQTSLESKINQTAESISLSVEQSGGANTSASIVISIKDADGVEHKTQVGTIDLTGIVTFNSLSTAGQTVINGANIQTGTVSCDTLNGGVITGQIINNGNGTFFVDADGNVTALNAKITGAITASSLTAYNSINMLNTNSEGSNIFPFAYLIRDLDPAYDTLYIRPPYSGDGTIHVKGALLTEGQLRSTGQIQTWSSVHIKSDNDGLQHDTYGWLIREATYNKKHSVCVGNASRPLRLWSDSDVYWKDSTTNIFAHSSDERLKEDIQDLSRYEKVYLEINPISYKYHNGLYGTTKTEWGFGANATAKLFEKYGIDWKDEDFIVIYDGELSKEESKYVDKDLLKINYQNMIALNTHMIQKTIKRVDELESENQQLKDKVADLENKLNAVLEKIGGIE